MRFPTVQTQLASLVRARIRVEAPRNQNAHGTKGGNVISMAPDELPKRPSSIDISLTSDASPPRTKRSSKRRHDKARRLNRKGKWSKVNPYTTHLSHNGEKRPRHTLFMGKSTLGDEQRATREHKVRPKYDKYRTRKAVGPIGLTVLDEREEHVAKCCEKRADTCGRSTRLTPPRPQRRIATGDRPRSPIKYTTGTLPTTKAIKTLHAMPVTKLGNSRTIVSTGERRR